MSGVQLSDILCYIGGHGYSRYGTATRRVTRIGRGGEEFQETVSRASVGTYVGNDGGIYSAASGVGRVTWKDYDGDGVRESPTILVEPTATNSLLQSQALATTPWTTSTNTMTNNAATAPDGTTTATKIIPNTSNVAHQVVQNFTGTASEYYAAEIALKPFGYTYAQIRISDGAGNVIGAAVDMSLGQVSNIGTGTNGTGVTNGLFITPLVDGWFRVGFWGKMGTSTSPGFSLYASDTLVHAQSTGSPVFAGDGTSGILAWEAQAERNGTAAGYPPTSYIPTTTATVTRATETWTVPITFSIQQLTVYLKIARPLAADSTGTPGTNQTMGLFSIGNGTSSSIHGYLAVATRTMGLGFDDDNGTLNLDWTAAIPSGTSLDMILQVKPGAAASVAADFGSGLTGFTGGTFPLTKFANPVIRIGGSADTTKDAVGTETDRLIVAAGLHTLSEMRAIL